MGYGKYTEKFQDFYTEVKLEFNASYSYPVIIDTTSISGETIKNLDSTTLFESTHIQVQNPNSYKLYINGNEVLDIAMPSYPDKNLLTFTSQLYRMPSPNTSDEKIINRNLQQNLYSNLADTHIIKEINTYYTDLSLFEEVAYHFDKSKNKLLFPIKIPSKEVMHILRTNKFSQFKLEFLSLNESKKIEKQYRNRTFKIYNYNQYSFDSDPTRDNYSFVKFYPPVSIDDITKNQQFQTADKNAFNDYVLRVRVFIPNNSFLNFQVVPITAGDGTIIERSYIMHSSSYEEQKEKIKTKKLEIVFYYNL